MKKYYVMTEVVDDDYTTSIVSVTIMAKNMKEAEHQANEIIKESRKHIVEVSVLTIKTLLD